MQCFDFRRMIRVHPQLHGLQALDFIGELEDPILLYLYHLIMLPEELLGLRMKNVLNKVAEFRGLLWIRQRLVQQVIIEHVRHNTHHSENDRRS